MLQNVSNSQTRAVATARYPTSADNQFILGSTVVGAFIGAAAGLVSDTPAIALSAALLAGSVSCLTASTIVALS